MRIFVLGFVLLSVAVVSVLGFRGSLGRKPPLEIFPDMDRQLKLRPQEPNDFFPSGVSSQLPVDGTVARTEAVVLGGREIFPFDEHPLNTGRETTSTNWVTVPPVGVDLALLERGRERYAIFCAPCHGLQGDGKGIVSRYNWPTIANLHEQRIIAQPDGEIFNTVTHGKNTMSGYSDKIPAVDRWAIVSYLRALQTSRLATLEDVPADQQSKLVP